MRTFLACLLAFAALSPPTRACAVERLPERHASGLSVPGSHAGSLSSPSSRRERVSGDPGTESRFDPSMGMILADASSVSAATPVPAPTSPEEAIGELPTILKDLKDGGPATLVGAGLIVLVLVYAFRAFVLPSLGLSQSVLPYVSLALGVALAGGGALAAGLPWYQALSAGLLAGFAAIGKHEVAATSGIPVPQGVPKS